MIFALPKRSIRITYRWSDAAMPNSNCSTAADLIQNKNDKKREHGRESTALQWKKTHWIYSRCFYFHFPFVSFWWNFFLTGKHKTEKPIWKHIKILQFFFVLAAAVGLPKAICTERWWCNVPIKIGWTHTHTFHVLCHIYLCGWGRDVRSLVYFTFDVYAFNCWHIISKVYLHFSFLKSSIKMRKHKIIALQLSLLVFCRCFFVLCLVLKLLLLPPAIAFRPIRPHELFRNLIRISLSRYYFHCFSHPTPHLLST